MTGIPAYSAFPRWRATSVRLRLALALSVAVHVLLAARIGAEAVPPGARAAAARVLSVWLEKPTAVEVALAVEPEPARQPAPRAGRPENANRAAPARHAGEENAGSPIVAVVPKAPDPTYYPAGELDSYPVPVHPFDVERFAETAAGPPASVRLTVLIDEHGVVRDVSVLPGAPSGAGERLRAALAAARFHPARKDGRAVAARLEISVRFR